MLMLLIVLSGGASVLFLLLGLRRHRRRKKRRAYCVTGCPYCGIPTLVLRGKYECIHCQRDVRGPVEPPIGGLKHEPNPNDKP